MGTESRDAGGRVPECILKVHGIECQTPRQTNRVSKRTRSMRNWAHESRRCDSGAAGFDAPAAQDAARDRGRPVAGVGVSGVRRCSSVDQVIVATDSDEIMRFCEQQGFAARMTSAAHRSGTERVHEISNGSLQMFI
jgi:hypothetical protein